ncbi:ABC transporter ATP-binding protein [Clostridium tarantellae]|nr:ABC transporter ATP-binding protein [Clostridium tarantellae]
MNKNLKKIIWILSHAKGAVFLLFLIILIESVLSIIGVYSTLVSKSLVDSTTSGQINLILKWLFIMVTIFGIQTLLGIASSFLGTFCSYRISNKIQTELFSHVTYAEWSEHSKYHSMNLLTRIGNDSGTVTNMLVVTIPSIISVCVLLISSFITLLSFNATIVIPAMLVLPIGIFLAKIFGLKMKKLNNETHQIQVKYKTFIQEAIQNIMIVKSFCMEKSNINKLQYLQRSALNISLKSSLVGTCSSLSLSLTSFFGYFIVFSWGIFNLARGTSTFGTFTALLQLFNNVQGPITGIAGIFPQFIGVLSATERLMEIEEMSLENLNEANIIKKVFNANIEFKNISFSYNENTPVLKDISFKVNNGESIALIGPSGEGKTTIIRLLLSLIKPTKGELCLIDKENTFINNNYRNLISYVPQGNTLFSGTIKENIVYGNNNFCEEDLFNSLKYACALDFIKELEKGLETSINEKGSGLSEGQCQRLAIARAFLRKKPILILDESTSSLDEETEIKVLQSVKNLPHKPICIIITHRPTALSICDKIFKLEKGKLNEINSYSIEKITYETALDKL